jgi:hypothetical protein
LAGRAARATPRRKGRGFLGSIGHGISVAANAPLDYLENFDPLSKDLPKKEPPHIAQMRQAGKMLADARKQQRAHEKRPH